MSKITSLIDEVPIYDGIAYFNDWLKEEQGSTREELQELLIAEGKSEGDIDFHFENLEMIFSNWCEQNGLQPQTV